MSQFTATARIPSRPLSYINIVEAFEKELVIDYATGEVYVVGPAPDKTVYRVTESIIAALKEDPTIFENIIITIPEIGDVTLNVAFDKVFEEISKTNTEVDRIDTALTGLGTTVTDIGLFTTSIDGVFTTIAGIKKVKPIMVATDASNRFVSDSEKNNWTSKTFKATIGTVWTGAEAPFTQEVSISGILETDNPVVDIVFGSADTYKQCMDKLDSYGLVYRITTFNGKIRIYASKATTLAVEIQLKIDR